MLALLFVVAYGIALAVCQSSHATASFAYQGCSSVDLSCFTSPYSECRCGDDSGVIKSVDESVCNYACMGDSSYGMCGTVCPDEGRGIANVYIKTEGITQDPQTQTLPTSSASDAYEDTWTSAPCASSAPVDYTTAQAEGMITPVGSAPEVPTTFTFVITSSSSGPCEESNTPALSSMALTTPCPLEDTSSTTESPLVTVASQTTTTCEEGPLEDNASSTNFPESTCQDSTTASPPIYTSGAQSAASSPTQPQPYTSEQRPTDPASNTSNLSTTIPSYSSASTQWARPSDIFEPSGQPSVPAQVPGSDSTHSMVPPLSTIGGLALIAAIIV
ncbi:uncharacterized protein UV8b_03464 [Ustilaginoidea virens]|uniref:Twinfilin-1 n=1 Tax=Ustilaginoidea virens TaxID=1159556 RepID=A0A8E5HPX5_USTVR|nr:uncharacterized protein UV8b_03464 [Ustilaginoidea virens]QUC19223.1 hypothetical protein UV8b_03464 [Ustilaginoidea virens]